MSLKSVATRTTTVVELHPHARLEQSGENWGQPVH